MRLPRALLLLICASCASAPRGPLPYPVADYRFPQACAGLRLPLYGGRGEPDSSRVDKGPKPLEPIRFAYPADRPPGSPGTVRAEFVIDSAGMPIPCTWRVVSASDYAFVIPAQETMLFQRFSPALKDGRPVTTLVRQSMKWRSRARL